MDKSLILAVAGSGKTTLIVDGLDLTKKSLVITYTINNFRNLRENILKKFGYFPENIELYTYFQFLYAFCFRPLFAYKIKPKGIFWETPPMWTRNIKRSKLQYYISADGRLYHNRIAKFLEQNEATDEINERIEKYYDQILIDEVQDIAGHDFNLLKQIAKANLEMKFVGDFFQHTFDTSRDGNVNSNLHTTLESYRTEFENMSLRIDDATLNRSYRCSISVCEFISDNLGIEMGSNKKEDSLIYYIDEKDIIEDIITDDNIIKLFYRENYKYNCQSRNWGDCKGENCYDEVCVILNKTSNKHYQCCPVKI